MVLVAKAQTNFTSGEISEYMYARQDLKQYENSARSIKNFIVRPQGGLFKRPGTAYVAEIKNSANDARLLPFEYSATQAYAIEMGAGYFRFFIDGGAILSGAAISNGTFATDLTGWTDLDTGTGASAWVTGTMELNGGAAGLAKRTQGVAFVGTNTHTLAFTTTVGTITYSIGTTSGGTEIATGNVSPGVQSINFTPSTAGTVYFSFSNVDNEARYVDTVSISTPVYQVENAYTQDEINEVQFAQSFDFLFLAHGSHPVFQLTRSNHDEWTIAETTFLDGPYYDITDVDYGGDGGSGITLDPSGTTGSVTVTASGNLFVSTDVGRLIRYTDNATDAWGYLRITAYTSATSVTALVIRTLVGGTASAYWRLGAWSATTGYPRTITFHDQRLVFGGTTDQQQTVWFSQAGDFFDFSPDNDVHKDEVDADTAMTYTIADARANVIRWLASQVNLFIGTTGGIWVARASSNSEALTPTNINIRPVIGESAAPYVPTVMQSSLVFIQRFGRKLLEITYSFANDAFLTSDLAILAEHRTIGKLQWGTDAVAPNYLMWFSTETGLLSGVTYLKDQNINAWHQHELGGDDVEIKSVMSIPGDTEDEVWMIVSRTIDGGTTQYIEYFSPTFIDNPLSEAKFLDSHITYSGAATSTLSGLDHLEGETVQVYDTEGFQVVVTGPVVSGDIVLDREVTSAVAGLPYVSSVMTNQFYQIFGDVSTVGKVGRLHQAALKFYRTYGGKIGISDTTNDVIPFLSDATIMDGPVTLFTGEINLEIPSEYSRTPVLYLEHDLPLPCNLLGIAVKASISSK